METASGVTVRGLRTSFVTAEGRRVNAVRDVEFNLEPGKVLTLLGPSGCGKTTTLRSIAGLERPSRGVISVGGKTVFDSANGTFLPPRERGLSMVFQSYAIWPHMNVFDNIAFPLRVKPRDQRINKADMASEVARALKIVDLSDFENRGASELSGGQRQRLALARALVQQPTAMLLDEPLSNLDAKLRMQMRVELKDLQETFGLTMIYVTHDQEEALALSDTLVVMRNGRIEQQGSPAEVYSCPKTPFVADFLGGANFVDGVVDRFDDRGPIVKTANGTMKCVCTTDLAIGQRVTIAIRPESAELAQLETLPETNAWQVNVRSELFLGGSRHYRVTAGLVELDLIGRPWPSLPAGESAVALFPREHCIALVPEAEADSEQFGTEVE